MQNLNLYQPERRANAGGPRPWQMRAGLALLLGLMLLHGAWQGWTLHRLGAAVATAQRQAQAVESELDGSRAAFHEPQLDPGLPLELARFESGNQQLQRLGEHLQLLDEQRGRGFVAPLQALAEQHPEGLWLTRIALHQGGTSMRLEGLSQDQELLPRYLQSLGRSETFQGRQFAQFKLQRDAAGLLRFSLGSRVESEEGGDE
ncbi:MAG: PilN domain-containing protein [Pseudomonas sp.]